MKYIIKIKEGGDVMSDEFDTHQEALWNLMNREEYDCGGIDRRKIFFIDSSDKSWSEKKLKCPKCGKIAGYLDHEMDIIECPHCKKNTFTGG